MVSSSRGIELSRNLQLCCQANYYTCCPLWSMTSGGQYIRLTLIMHFFMALFKKTLCNNHWMWFFTCCKLHKAIYRLKYDHGFVNFIIFFLLWVLKLIILYLLNFEIINILFVLIYMDDIIITWSSLIVVQDFVKNLRQSFALKDLGQLDYFLGV